MPLAHIPLRQITVEHIKALIDNEEMEDRFLDYKLELYGKKDDDDRELCYDITAFANAFGGDIICGVREGQRDGKNTGIPEAIVGIQNLNADEVIRRYYQILNARVQPRLSRVEIREIPGDTGPVVIIRVPRSWAMPHVVRNNDWFKCYIRRGASKGDPIDVHQLRDAFLLSSTIHERVRAFRSERLDLISGNRMPIQLGNESKVIIHIVSLASFDGGNSLKWENGILGALQPPNLPVRDVMAHHIRANRRFNLDGYLIYNDEIDVFAQPAKAERFAYMQIFREGAFEMVDSLRANEKELPRRFGTRIIDYFTHVFKEAEGLDFSPPAYVMITLMGVNGTGLYTNGDPPPQTPAIIGRYHPFDRSLLVLPEVLLEDFNNLKSSLRPAFDALWQAGGWSAYFEN